MTAILENIKIFPKSFEINFYIWYFIMANTTNKGEKINGN